MYIMFIMQYVFRAKRIPDVGIAVGYISSGFSATRICINTTVRRRIIF